MPDRLADQERVQGYVSGFLVVLNSDRKDERAQAVLDAIRMVRGVQSVEPIKGDGLQEALWRSRHYADLIEGLAQVAREVSFGKDK